MNKGQKIIVGKIVAAQGIRGELRVQTYTQNADDFRDLKTEPQLQFVRTIPNSSIVIMRAENVNDRTGAENLRGTEIYIDKSALPALPEGEFYHDDLIGMTFNSPPAEGCPEGAGRVAVVAVHNFGAGDIVELSNGEMVSFAGLFVDFDKREITK